MDLCKRNILILYIMKVKLISYSKPHDTDSKQNIQDLIAYCARVSNPANQNK